jgi:hypothetical protein
MTARALGIGLSLFAAWQLVMAIAAQHLGDMVGRDDFLIGCAATCVTVSLLCFYIQRRCHHG